MVFKQMLAIGAAAISFPALAQTAEPVDGWTPPAEQPAPTDTTQPAPADTPTDDAQPVDANAPTDSAPADGETPDEPAAEPNSGL